MKQYSAGLIIYTYQQDTREYLVLQYASGHWDFPKGKLEQGETNHEAAVRELYEETGLSAQVLPDFAQSLDYYFRDYKTGQLIHKTVIFFIGYTTDKQVKLSHEHIGYTWLPFQQAYALTTYDNAKHILQEAEKFLTDYDKK